MNVHLNILIRKDGEMYRNELFVGKFNEIELAERNEFKNKFAYGKDDFDGKENMVLCWYAISLEDKERNEVSERRKSNL